jgi:hypothetical protein
MEARNPDYYLPSPAEIARVTEFRSSADSASPAGGEGVAVE